MYPLSSAACHRCVSFTVPRGVPRLHVGTAAMGGHSDWCPTTRRRRCQAARRRGQTACHAMASVCLHHQRRGGKKGRDRLAATVGPGESVETWLRPLLTRSPPLSEHTLHVCRNNLI